MVFSMKKSVFAVSYIIPLIILVLSLQTNINVDVYSGDTCFNGTKAYSLLKHLVRNYKYRIVGTLNDSLAARWVEDYFKSLDLETYVINFSTVNFKRENVVGINVYAVKHGLTDEYIVLVAHRDIVPRTIEGANDNGAGVAILLELARALKDRDTRYSIIFLVSDSEETGLHGAENFVRSFPEIDKVRYAVSIDMCGWRNSTGIGLYAFISWSYRASDANILLVMFQLEKLGYNVKIEVFTPNGFLEQVVYRLGLATAGTDSMPFIDAGIPAVGIGDYPLYPYWHTPEDSIDKVSPERLQYVGEFLERFVLTVDRANIGSYGVNYLFLDSGFIGEPIIYLLALSLCIPLLVSLIYDIKAGARISMYPIVLFLMFLLTFMLTYMAPEAVVLALWFTRGIRLFEYLHYIVAASTILYIILLRIIIAPRIKVDYEIASALRLVSKLVLFIEAVVVSIFNPVGSLFMVTPTVFATPLFSRIKKYNRLYNTLLLLLSLIQVMIMIGSMTVFLGIERIGLGLAWILYCGLESMGIVNFILLLSLAATSLTSLYYVSITRKY